jgi:predicted transcriptional regulator
MKTAISIPDDLFADAERLAEALKKSRSRLYGDAVREYLARHSAERVTETLDALCVELAPGGEPVSSAKFTQAAARRTLERSDW